MKSADKVEMRSATPSNDDKPHLAELTGARFVAALGVLGCHTLGNFIPVLPTWAIWAIGQGGAGVSFFFVLSGFVLTYNYFEKFSAGLGVSCFKSYVQARIARVWPMHAVALLLMTPITIYLLKAGSDQILYAKPANAVSAGGSWLLNLLLLQVYVPSMSAQNLWNAPSWSVATEVFFYAGFPLLIRLVWSRIRSLNTLVLLLVAMYLIEVILFAVVHQVIRELTHGDDWEPLSTMILYRMPFLRIWEFLIGCGLAMPILRGVPWLARRWVRNSLVGLGLVAVAVVIVSLMARVPYVMTLSAYVIYTPAFSAIILGLSAGRTFLSPLLCFRPVLLLGKASYSLYLIHWGPVLLLQHFYDDDDTSSAWAGAAVVAACLIGSVICYLLIERPGRHWLRKGRPRTDTAPQAAEAVAC